MMSSRVQWMVEPTMDEQGLQSGSANKRARKRSAKLARLEKEKEMATVTATQLQQDSVIRRRNIVQHVQRSKRRGMQSPEQVAGSLVVQQKG